MSKVTTSTSELSLSFVAVAAEQRGDVRPPATSAPKSSESFVSARCHQSPRPSTTVPNLLARRAGCSSQPYASLVTAIGLPSVRLSASCSCLRYPRNLFTGKLKFNFKGKDAWSRPFITLLQGRTNEIILRDPDQLQYIADAAEEASQIPGSDIEQLEQLKKIIEKKKMANGTKAQLKPAFDNDGGCEKVAVVVKWGGEVSSSD